MGGWGGIFYTSFLLDLFQYKHVYCLSYLAFFGCILNGNLHDWARILVAFSQLQQTISQRYVEVHPYTVYK